MQFFSEHHHDRQVMIDELWHALDQADIVIGYNNKGFDNKHAMREFITSGLGPPSPWQDVDLLKENRRLFKFASNRLLCHRRAGVTNQTGDDCGPVAPRPPR